MRHLLLALIALSLSACSAEKPKPPTFVTYDSVQGAAINAGSQSAASGFSDITSRLAAAEEPQLAGTEVQVSDSIINTGAPASGVKVIVKGSAFDTGLFGAPIRGRVATSTAKDEGGPSADLTLTQDDSGAYTGEANVKCEKLIIVSFIVMAKKGGNADVQVLVKPLDKGGLSSASFTHNYTVRSTGDENSSE